DSRSPLERFRTTPKKPLSVTDIVSPAWCEIQYWYTLTKHGRKLRTPAMKQGSAVHRILEEQVHTIVPITVQTKEDSWGLKIWNVIQGLRTLRVTGLTRELEVWGVVEGQVINGIIDELSYTCPDPQLEAEIEAEKDKHSPTKSISPSQQKIDEYFGTRSRNSTNLNLYQTPPEKRKIYLTDIKTRSRPSLPKGVAFRPTLMQLMLYRSLLASLAANTVPANTIFARYDLNPSTPFTDAFIAEISNLEFNFSDDAGLNSEDRFAPMSSQGDAINELQQHNNLTLLWQLMIQEFVRTIPSADCIGEVLRAEFILARDQSVLGSKCFAYDEDALTKYVQDEMKWWRGERKPRGVEVEEAYKCRVCEFAEDCTWRKEKMEEAIGRQRERRGRLSTGSGV
ncbi:hypothetical protein NA57DRAFT_34144, partial [Rhizodiscina lignyota]